MRLKILSALIIFFVGFMTALYVTAPDKQSNKQTRAEVWANKLQSCDFSTLLKHNKQ